MVVVSLQSHKQASRAVSMEIAFVITLPIKLGLWSYSRHRPFTAHNQDYWRRRLTMKQVPEATDNFISYIISNVAFLPENLSLCMWIFVFHLTWRWILFFFLVCCNDDTTLNVFYCCDLYLKITCVIHPKAPWFYIISFEVGISIFRLDTYLTELRSR